MLINFTVKNFRSIKDEMTISFLANKQIKDSEEPIIFSNNDLEVLSFGVIYGPNSSGKSNILNALYVMFSFITRSNTLNLDEDIPFYDPFLLDDSSRKAPTRFELEFLISGIEHSYIIEFDKKNILLEELKFYPEGRQARYYSRVFGEDIKYGTYMKGDKKLLEKTCLPNQLYLSKSAVLQIETPLKSIFRHLRDAVDFHTNMDSSYQPVYNTSNLLNSDAGFKKDVLNLMTAADFNILDIRIEEKLDEKNKSLVSFPDDIPKEIREKIIESMSQKTVFTHPVYDDSGKVLGYQNFDMDSNESGGTVKVYDLAFEILKALDLGSTLVIDEFDSGLHPDINRFIINLFLSKESNPNKAQLFVATHDTCIMNLDKMRRDQIWFANKDRFGATSIYSSDEFDKNIVRKDSNLSNLYLDGRLGALPLINYNLMKREKS